MKKEQLIHIKLDADEAMQSRKDILNTEFDLVKIAQAIKRYRILRLKELELKINLYKQTKDFVNDMHHLKTMLPKLEIPKLLKKHEEEMHAPQIKEKIKKEKKVEPKKQKIEKKLQEKKPVEDSLEKQLREIQEKLNKIE
jgi:hypothetical protein